MNILHWPISYPDIDKGQPFSAIFVQEHIKSVLPYTRNRVLYIAPESCSTKKWHERIDRDEDGVIVTRLYFNRKLNLQFLNLYIRFIILCYFIELIIKHKFKPDIIHLHFFQAGEWASLFSNIFQIPTVCTEHWTAFIGYPVISKERFKSASEVFAKASHILPVSEHLLKGMIASTGYDFSSKSTVINNSVDTSLFNIAENATPHQTLNLVSVARLDEQKDIPTMLQTFKIVSETYTHARLTIIGGGEPAPYHELATQLGIQQSVHFVGPKTKREIADYMNQSDLFILSSISENSPCVIGEAHCCGLPVVATDVGGVKELIISGGVVPAKSPELLAKKVIEVMHAGFDRKAISQEAKTRFSYDAIGSKIYKIYQSVLNK